MLIRTSRLKNFQMRALDGEIGRARDFLFDDSNWKVRYMVANTGNWLFGQQVLITPQLLQAPDLPDEKIPLKITKEEFEKAPSIEVDQPVSRQYEKAYADYFSHSYYWLGGSSLEAAITADARVPVEEEASESKAEDDRHLRSVEEVIGYRVDAGGKQLGLVDDFIVDTQSWDLVLVGVDTHKWLPAKQALLPVAWAKDISWVERSLTADVDPGKLEAAPEFSDDLLDTKTVAQLYKHYGRSQGA